jgi:hypothetical protein
MFHEPMMLALSHLMVRKLETGAEKDETGDRTLMRVVMGTLNSNARYGKQTAWCGDVAHSP